MPYWTTSEEEAFFKIQQMRHNKHSIHSIPSLLGSHQEAAGTLSAALVAGDFCKTAICSCIHFVTSFNNKIDICKE